MRHLYTEWEENPGEAIEMSKHRLSFPISGDLGETTPIFDSETSDSSPTHSISMIADSCTNSSVSLELEKENVSEPLQTSPSAESVAAVQSANTLEDNCSAVEQSQEAELPENGYHGDDKTTGIITMTTSSTSSEVPTSVPESTNADDVTVDDVTVDDETVDDVTVDDVTVDDDDDSDKMLSATVLLQKQARVRESLKMQGVVSCCMTTAN